jgi:outer membrane usher protein
VGRTDDDGHLFVPDLQPHYANRLSIESSDLPLEYEPGEKEILFAPAERGGAVMRFAATPARFVRGRVVFRRADGEQSVRYGDAYVSRGADRASSPIGSSGEFEFEGLDSGRWALEVVSPEGECKTELDVPSDDQALVNLGQVACSPSPVEEQPSLTAASGAPP